MFHLGTESLYVLLNRCLLYNITDLKRNLIRSHHPISNPFHLLLYLLCTKRYSINNFDPYHPPSTMIRIIKT